MPEPLFKTVLGDDWDKLGPIVQRHYSLQVRSNDYVRVDGVMDKIYHSWPAKLLIPFGRLFGAIVPFNAQNVPIQVHYRSKPSDSCLYWDRIFMRPNKKPFHFKSHMEHIDDNLVIEYVRFGVGLQLLVTAEDGALVFRDAGYIWRVLGYKIPLPMGLLFGNAYIEERPIDEREFSMKLEIKHPLFGMLFLYQGRFTVGIEKLS